MSDNKDNPFDPFSFAKGFEDMMVKGTIGFENVLQSVQDAVKAFPKMPVYPPYNIRKLNEDHYVIEVALAGFGKQDIDIEFQGGILTVSGKVTKEDGDDAEYLYRGIANRAFQRKFTVADSVTIQDASFINGLLKIYLDRFIPVESSKIKIK
jgi:molecular chaperone IbpA